MARITVYVKDNCNESARALDIISWLKSFVPSLEINVINVSHENAPEFIQGADGPVYEVAGFMFNGNPDSEQLRQILELIAINNLN